jgi:hypothetical protein
MPDAFKKGDRVAWHQTFAALHAPGSIVTAEAVGAHAPGAQLGKVAGFENEAKTHVEVDLDDGETKVLTVDELVKIAE